MPNSTATPIGRGGRGLGPGTDRGPRYGKASHDRCHAWWPRCWHAWPSPVTRRPRCSSPQSRRACRERSPAAETATPPLQLTATMDTTVRCMVRTNPAQLVQLAAEGFSRWSSRRAHALCLRTSSSSSCRARVGTSISSCMPALPKTTAALRCTPRSFARLIGELAWRALERSAAPPATLPAVHARMSAHPSP